MVRKRVLSYLHFDHSRLLGFYLGTSIFLCLCAFLRVVETVN